MVILILLFGLVVAGFIIYYLYKRNKKIKDELTY